MDANMPEVFYSIGFGSIKSLLHASGSVQSSRMNLLYLCVRIFQRPRIILRDLLLQISHAMLGTAQRSTRESTI
jgi:hypothetical protein